MVGWRSRGPALLWRRVGDPFELGAWLVGGNFDLAWGWRVEREGVGHRQVRVEVAKDCLHSTELPDDAKRAIDSQGASAVDAFLNEEEPPSVIVVSAAGVRAEGPAGT
jgi:hypothetical protein